RRHAGTFQVSPSDTRTPRTSRSAMGWSRCGWDGPPAPEAAMRALLAGCGEAAPKTSGQNTRDGRRRLPRSPAGPPTGGRSADVVGGDPRLVDEGDDVGDGGDHPGGAVGVAVDLVGAGDAGQHQDG